MILPKSATAVPSCAVRMRSGWTTVSVSRVCCGASVANGGTGCVPITTASDQPLSSYPTAVQSPIAWAAGPSRCST